MDTDENPYHPAGSVVEERETKLQSTAVQLRWRVIPAFVVGMIGLASTAFGLLAVAILASILVRNWDASLQPEASLLPELLAGCCVYLGFGGCWMASGVLVWKSRYRFALMLASMGIVIPVVLLSIFSP